MRGHGLKTRRCDGSSGEKVKAGHIYLCRVAGNTVRVIPYGRSRSSEKRVPFRAVHVFNRLSLVYLKMAIKTRINQSVNQQCCDQGTRCRDRDQDRGSRVRDRVQDRDSSFRDRGQDRGSIPRDRGRGTRQLSYIINRLSFPKRQLLDPSNIICKLRNIKPKILLCLHVTQLQFVSVWHNLSGI